MSTMPVTCELTHTMPVTGEPSRIVPDKSLVTLSGVYTQDNDGVIQTRDGKRLTACKFKTAKPTTRAHLGNHLFTSLKRA